MSKINFSRILSYFKPIIYYLAIFLIPLAMSLFFPIYSPFTMVKSAWFQVLTSLLLLTYSVSFWLSFKRKKIRINKKFLVALTPWALFLAVLLILNFFSIDPLQSFFGSYNRQMGFLFYFSLATWFSLIVFYFSAFDKQQNEAFLFWEKGVSRTALVMSISASLVAVYACLQFLGYDLFLWQEGQLLSRSISSLGQPNFLGSFLLFGLLMTAYLFYLNKKLFFRLLIAISFIIQFFALIASGSRSAWLALLFTVFLYLLAFLWHKWRYKSLIIASLVAFTLFFILLALSPNRMQGLFNWGEGSLGLRSYFYQAAPALMTDNLYVGSGLENGGELIIKSYDPDWGIFMRINGSSDKVHNSLLDAFLQLGIFGFLSYLILYLFVIYQFILLWQRPRTKFFAVFAGGALIAYSFSLLFGLADIANVFYFWVLAALATAANLIFNESGEDNRVKKSLKKIIKVFKFERMPTINSIYVLVLTIILAGLAIFQAYMSISSISADHYFLQVHKYSLNKDYATANLLYDYIIDDSLNPSYINNYQRKYAFFLTEALAEAPSLSVSRFLENSAKQILLDLPLNTYDDFYSFAVLNCSLNGPEHSLDKFEQLIKISPKRPEIFISIGDCLSHEDPESALNNYEHALTLLPQISDQRLIGEHAAYLNFYNHLIYYKIASLHKQNTENEAALINYEKAYYFYPSKISTLGEIAKTYYYLKDYQSAFESLEHAYHRQADVYWLDQLASLAHTIGDDGKYEKYLDQRRIITGQEFIYLEEDLLFP